MNGAEKLVAFGVLTLPEAVPVAANMRICVEVGTLLDLLAVWYSEHGLILL
jgi:hypothetical protein